MTSRKLTVIGNDHSPKRRELRADLEPAVMTANELAAVLRVNRKTIYEAAQRGEIPGTLRVGRTLRFSKAAVASWLGQDRFAPTQEGADDVRQEKNVA